MNGAQKVLKLAMVTGEILTRAQRRQQEKTAGVNAAAALIPQAVESLVKNARIQPQQATKVAEGLKSHSTALELLRDVAKHRNADELSIGTTQPKVAAVHNGSRGGPVDFDDTLAGQVFAQKIMGGRH